MYNGTTTTSMNNGTTTSVRATRGETCAYPITIVTPGFNAKSLPISFSDDELTRHVQD